MTRSITKQKVPKKDRRIKLTEEMREYIAKPSTVMRWVGLTLD